MAYLLPLTRKKGYQVIEALRTKLEPSEYCRKWVPKLHGKYPEDRGYYLACVKELSEVSGITDGAIRNWGTDFKKCPEYFRNLLSWVDVVRQVQSSVDLPPSFPSDTEK